jgi:hydrocephalus-inducing protein
MLAFESRREVSIGVKPSEDVLRVAKPRPEPTYQPAPGAKPKDIAIKVFLISDILKYTIETTEISFAPTMMFQTRVAEFRLTNVSQIRMDYGWELMKFESLRTDYAMTHPCVFSIEPTTGFIEGGQTTTFRALFSPLEVDDFTAKFTCKIPFLTTEPPKVTMTGFSRRPLCHFNVVVSDYLKRRHPDFTEPVPDDTQVLEIFATPGKAKTIKKVEVINPTSSPYEITWEVIRDDAGGTITCESPSAFVSSGKKHFFVFQYVPATPRVVECLFQFTIPEHQIKAPFLVVGRVSR